MDLDDLATRRIQYETAGFDVADADPDPHRQFVVWFEAVVDDLDEPNRMIVATSTPDAVPGVRTVLLRSMDERGLVFHTNYRSAKGRAIAANPIVEVLFSWMPAHRQVRVLGRVETLPADESDAYFAGRPRSSQVSAWASAQSDVLADRSALEASVAEIEARFAGVAVPRPPHWGGYLVRPTSWEFWQGRADRLHDRVRYRRASGADWVRERLAP